MITYLKYYIQKCTPTKQHEISHLGNLSSLKGMFSDIDSAMRPYIIWSAFAIMWEGSNVEHRKSEDRVPLGSQLRLLFSTAIPRWLYFWVANSPFADNPFDSTLLEVGDGGLFEAGMSDNEVRGSISHSVVAVVSIFTDVLTSPFWVMWWLL